MLKQYGSENLRVEYDYKEKEWVVEGYKQEPFDYPSIEIMGRDGGYALNILMRIGFENVDELMMKEEETNLFLKNPQSFDS